MTAAPITIITPTFNAGATLAACLQSVAAQSLAPLEHWIIDGASTDNTLAIVQQFAAQCPHLKYISEKDGGIYHAMNKGIALAQGQWLYFLGADDTLADAQVLAEVAQALAEQPVDVIYGDVMMIDGSNAYRYAGKFDSERIQHQNICHQAMFFRRSLFDQLGNFDLRFRACADWDFNLRWLLPQQASQYYMHRIIANYSRGGFSSLNGDNAFNDMKNRLILKYGRQTLAPKVRAFLFYELHPAKGTAGRVSTKLKYQLYKYCGLFV